MSCAGTTMSSCWRTTPTATCALPGKTCPPSSPSIPRAWWSTPASFSKVISPGMRVGYAIGPKAVLQKMVVCKQGEDVHSNMWAQIVCHRIMTEYDFEAHLRTPAGHLPPEELRPAGGHGAVLQAPWASPGAILRAACSPGAPCPLGWICWSLSRRPRSTRCAWCPAPLSSPTRASPASAFRINFSTPTDEQLHRGHPPAGPNL